MMLKGESKKGLALTHNYVNPNEFCDFNNHIAEVMGTIKLEG